MISDTINNGYTDEQGNFDRPIYLNIPGHIPIENLIRYYTKSQAQLFKTYEEALGESIPKIPSENIQMGLEAAVVNFPSIRILTELDPLEDANVKFDKRELFIILFLQEESPHLLYKSGLLYEAIMISFLETMPSGEFFRGWPPAKQLLASYGKLKQPQKLINHASPMGRAIKAKLGLRPVISLELSYAVPELVNI
jgi:hypothetical protein